MSHSLTIVGIFRNKLCLWNCGTRNIVKFPMPSNPSIGDKEDLKGLPVFNSWEELEMAATGNPLNPDTYCPMCGESFEYCKCK